MHNVSNNLTLFDFQALQSWANPAKAPLQLQSVVSLAMNLQATVLKQQAIIETLMNQLNTEQQKLAEASKLSPEINVKNEEGAVLKSKQNIQISRNCSTTTTDTQKERNAENGEKKAPKIIRRFGFKGVKKTKSIKEEGEGNESDDKDSKAKNSSNAKHLWVNYGRRIIEYAINETQGTMQARVKQLAGKLSSKRDFEKAFQITSNDTAEDKLFKTLLGRLAIQFVKHKASPTFENSKYREQMITQRHVVAAWIERLIGE